MGEAGYFFTNLVGKSFIEAVYRDHASRFGWWVAGEYKVRKRSPHT